MMKCPKCRKAMPVEAVTHECGWRVSSGGVNAAVEEMPPATLEQRRAWIDKMRALFGPIEVREPRERSPGKAPMLRDVGHGVRCTCAVCWNARFPQRAVPIAAPPGIVGPPAATTADPKPPAVAATSAQVHPQAAPAASASASRYDALKKLFPIEE